MAAKYMADFLKISHILVAIFLSPKVDNSIYILYLLDTVTSWLT